MSFILDALKKVEENRQKGSVPDITTVHTPGDKSRKRLLWPVALILVLIFNVLLIGWIYGLKKTVNTDAREGEIIQKIEPALNNSLLNTNHKSMSAPETIITNMPPQHIANPDIIQDTALADNDLIPDSNEPDEIEPPIDLLDEQTPVPANIIQEQALTEAVYQPSIIADDTSINNHSDIPELEEMPADFQKSIPKIIINGHIYSDDSSTRLANINGNIVKEGNLAGPNLTVQEITVSGVLFKYKDRTFHLRAF
ncbi:general secretion pathway protein GspB [bacterium]|nr:general secretion pathway protein GspB [bacterium]